MPDDQTKSANSIRDIDGGLASRKLWITVLTMVLLVVVALLTTKIPSLVPLYATISGSLIGALAIYCGGNIATRWVHKDTMDGDKPAAPAP